MQNLNTPQVLITPLKPALIMGMAQKLPVLVRVQAPDPDPALKKERKPYHLSLVIDRSGSMSGEPLLEAVRCAKHIVDRLESTDVASLIVFDDRVKTLAPAKPVGDRKALYAALAHVRSGGSTNLHGGWQTGAAEILDGVKQAALARVILLSDGNANVGETTDTNEIATLCADAAEKGVTTSTYGLGRDFNEELMVEMGKRGGGNHYYGDTAADLFEPFAEEFDFISNLYARHVRLALAAPEGVKITLLNDYPVEQREGFPLVRLPDIPLGAEAWALVELEIPAGMALESGNQLLQAGVTASTPDGSPIAIPDATLTLKAMSPQAWEALLQDPLVVARQTELEAGKFLDQARAAAEHGDWATIQKMIAEGQKRFADNPWILEVLEGMAEIAKDMDSARFRNPKIRSFFACGDFNQRLTTWGSRSVDDVKWVHPEIDIKEITVSYRQSRKLNDLARAIIVAAGGTDSGVTLPAHVDNEGVPPTLLENAAEQDEVVDWLAQRIREIEQFLEQMPSIAIFVESEAEVQPLADALNEALAAENAQVVACPKGQVMGQDNDVRVFDVQHIKGLEFEAVFFVGVDRLATIHPQLFDKYLYVGTTRATSRRRQREGLRLGSRWLEHRRKLGTSRRSPGGQPVAHGIRIHSQALCRRSTSPPDRLQSRQRHARQT